MMGKLSCRVITGIVKADFTNMKIENLFDITTTPEFYRILEENFDKSVSSINSVNIESLCYMKEDVWTKILSHD
jgi:hypothetical protein